MHAVTAGVLINCRKKNKRSVKLVKECWSYSFAIVVVFFLKYLQKEGVREIRGRKRRNWTMGNTSIERKYKEQQRKAISSIKKEKIEKQKNSSKKHEMLNLCSVNPCGLSCHLYFSITFSFTPWKQVPTPISLYILNVSWMQFYTQTSSNKFLFMHAHKKIFLVHFLLLPVFLNVSKVRKYKQKIFQYSPLPSSVLLSYKFSCKAQSDFAVFINQTYTKLKNTQAASSRIEFHIISTFPQQ